MSEHQLQSLATNGDMDRKLPCRDPWPQKPAGAALGCRLTQGQAAAPCPQAWRLGVCPVFGGWACLVEVMQPRAGAAGEGLPCAHAQTAPPHTAPRAYTTTVRLLLGILGAITSFHS